jgi:oligosaccharyl transferase STT3 subunit
VREPRPDRPRSAWTSVALLVVAVALVAATRSWPTWTADDPDHAAWSYRAPNGQTYPYLTGMDSYSWVRKARNYLASGTPCDEETAEGCRDRLRHAPVGSAMPYADSLHIRAIAWLHRVLAIVDGSRPIDASAFWLQVVVGTLGVVPAWAIGARLAGPWAGFLAALLVGMSPAFFDRSLGADNDVWNVVLPLAAAAAVLRALDEPRRGAQVAWAAVAGCVLAVHAAIWRGWLFGFVVIVAGVVASALPAVLRASRSGARAALAAAAAPLVVAACLAGSTLALTALPHGPAPVTATVPAPTPAPDAGPRAAEFPDGLRDVGELRPLDFAQIRDRLGGPVLTLGAIVGILVLLLPAGGAAGLEVQAVAGAAALLALGTLLEVPIGWLALGVGVALAVVLRARARSRDGADAAAPALLVGVWLAAALYMSLDAQRWLLLAVAPIGLAYAGGAVRAAELVGRRLGAPAWRWIVLAVLAVPVGLWAYEGVGRARDLRPELNDAWWESLREIDATAPPDAIVHATWPHGYWIEFFARRAASADGASVLTHIPYWTARALLARDPQEALGLFRMLDCGSDAWHEPEARFGAYERLRAAGADGLDAHDLVVALARLDRAGADRLLGDRGFDAATRDQILAATHCTPPPAYLVLADTQARQPGIRREGNWDPRRAALVHRLRERPEEDAIAAATRDLGFSETDARELWTAARRLHTDAEMDEFIAPTTAFYTRWVPCRREGAMLACAANVERREGLVLERFSYPLVASAHDRGTLRFREAGRATERPPDALVVSDADGVRDVTETVTPDADRWGVVVDVPGSRAIFGPPYLVRSMLVRLALLGGTAPGFEKVADHKAADERVVTWRLRWPPAP